MTNIGILALAALFTSAGANQQVIVVNGSPIVRLSLAQFDLSRDADRRSADRLIRSAVDRVCSAMLDSDALYPETVACVKSSLTDARSQLAAAIKQSAEREGPSLATIGVGARH